MDWNRIAEPSPWIGRPLERNEDMRLLTGQACFVDDFHCEGMVHAVVVRSAVGHARITGIDASQALALPGVLAVYTYEDMREHLRPIPIRLAPLPGFEHFLQQPIARDRVRYVGEPVAVVVAEDRYVAEDAAELVMVDYHTLPAVVSAEAALEDASLLFPEVGTNVASHYEVSRGDVDAAFASADYVRKERFSCHRHSALPLETRGLVSRWDADTQRLTVWGATKVPFFNRRVLAGMLGLQEQDIDLLELDVGGSFGVRGEFYPEDFLVPFAAMRTGRPVKWIEDRRESFMATNHSREMSCELEIAARKDGTLLGMRAHLWADLGAYVRTNGGVVPAKGAQMLPGPYRIANYACEVHALVTNKTPIGTYRGPGRYEANFFRERLLDMVAADLGLDAAEIRRINMIAPEDLPYDGGKLVTYTDASSYDTGDYRQTLELALEHARYGELASQRGRRIDGRYHGVGMGCFVESSGGGPAESARIVIRGPGQVELYTGCSSSGQGQETVLAQILADVLGVPYSLIQVFHGSTNLVTRGYGTYHSRGVVMGGSAVKVAADILASQVLALAAQRAGRPVSDFRLEAGQVWCKDQADEPWTSLEALAGEAEAGDEQSRRALTAEGTFENSILTYTYGCHVAHVAVDPETAQVEVLDYVVVEDVGKVINPLIVHGQAVGAAIQGMGGTFLDQFLYDENGQLLTGTFADYLQPVATDFAVVRPLTLENFPSRLNPLGAKGAGEGGIVATAASLANAIADALRGMGVKLCHLPFSLDVLAREIREARPTAADAATDRSH